MASLHHMNSAALHPYEAATGENSSLIHTMTEDFTAATNPDQLLGERGKTPNAGVRHA